MTTVTIRNLAYGGAGIATLPDGRTAFVEGGCPGDVVQIVITEDRERFVRATIERLVEPSVDRTTPPCPFFGSCGGCQWQHVSYEAQLTAKHASVVDALRRIGKLDLDSVDVRPIIASPSALGYRNKLELVPDPAARRFSLGMHRAGSDEIVSIDRCLLLPKATQRAPRALSGALSYLTGEGDLGILRVGIRAAAHTRDVEIALWTEPGPFPRAAISKTLSQALTVSSIVRVLVKGPTDKRKVSGVEVLHGKGHWRERMSGHTFAISAPSFFQVNTDAAERLVATAIELLEPDGTDRVLDLYSGAGTFTVPLAHLAGEVVAVEAAGSAVRDLRRNLETEQAWADVQGGDAAREIDQLGHFDKIVVDPPRSGLAEKVVTGIASLKPEKLVYVSCDPATLARDTARLASAGYRLAVVQPVDLFPQTFHVETVTSFERV